MIRKKSWFSKQHKGNLILYGSIILSVLIFTIYLFTRITTSNKKIIQINFIAILFGLLFEYKQIVKKWTTVLLTALPAFIFSLFAFTKDRGESNYILENHLTNWPYIFLLIFIIFASIICFFEGTKKITEGFTLMMTLSFNYWIIENDYWNAGYLIIKILFIFNILFSVFSIFHALTYSILEKGTRLFLSIWTTIIALFLSFDNILKLYQYRDIEHLDNSIDMSIAFLQYFFLGISSVYIAHNIAFIGAYLPGKDYLNNVRDINSEHVKRYSNEQVDILDSIIAIVLGITFFALNYFYHFLPTNLMIWIYITITPLLLLVINRIIK